jgi:hypothetical protein
MPTHFARHHQVLSLLSVLLRGPSDEMVAMYGCSVEVNHDAKEAKEEDDVLQVS